MRTIKKHFEATRDFYFWIAEQTDLDLWKEDWPGFEKIRLLWNNCAFCEMDMVGCKKCPLAVALRECCNVGSSYQKCCYPELYRKTKKAQIRLRRKHALKIAEFTDRYIKAENQ